MTSIEIHDIKKIEIEKRYLEDTKTHVLNIYINTERSGFFEIAFFAESQKELILIHKKEVGK